MAQYPIKMLKDENGTPFVPLVAPEAVKDSQGIDLQSILDTKLEKGNIIAGSNITLSVSGSNITINSTAGGATTNIIDNLNQSTGGVGVLDAHQGYVLKGMIPGVQNTLTSTSTTDALSAYQGYLLSNRSVPDGGTTGQILVKNSATNNDVSWTSDYLPKSGGILTGKVGIGASSSDMGLSFSVNDSEGENAQLSFGVGASHDNHGVYSDSLNKWLIYANQSSGEVRLPEDVKIATTGFTNLGIATYSNANGKTIRFTNGIQICFGEVSGTTNTSSTTMGSANVYYAQAD